MSTIAFAGRIEQGNEDIFSEGITAVFSIMPELTSLDEALENGYLN